MCNCVHSLYLAGVCLGSLIIFIATFYCCVCQAQIVQREMKYAKLPLKKSKVAAVSGFPLPKALFIVEFLRVDIPKRCVFSHNIIILLFMYR